MEPDFLTGRTRLNKDSFVDFADVKRRLEALGPRVANARGFL